MSRRSFDSSASLDIFGVLHRQNPTAQSFSHQTPLTHDDALAVLYEAHGARLYRYAVMLLGDRTAAEDVLHEGFVRLAEAMDRRPHVELTFGYVATVVRNECYTVLRKWRRRREDPLPLIERESPDATEEERMILDRTLRTLPAEQREVVYLKVFEGLTFQEIADRCAVSINTAASRYRYAMEAMRRSLAPGEAR
jgi:RNA polymerase sigma-70 factor, ECF subfamily